jgi:hypothetical protein
MLAQAFKPADELQITEAQKDALIKTLVLMETGKLIHTPFPKYYAGHGGSFTGQFNMDGWHGYADCGTVCCIGGTAELVGGVSFNDEWVKNDCLCELFAPNIVLVENWSLITLEQAARALRSYLTTGRANWAAAMGEA